MPCRSCQSSNQRVFESEINVHFPALKDLRRKPVLTFPNVVICLDCGFMESKIDQDQLNELIEGDRETKDAD